MGKSFKNSKRFYDDYDYEENTPRYTKKAKDRRNEKKLKKKLREQSFAYSDDGEDDSYV